jgi:cytochrome c553
MRTLLYKILAASLCCSLAVGSACAADASGGEALADACTSCHGVNGHSKGYIPSLDTLSRTQFIQMLEQYSEQKGTATIMNRIARTYTAAEIELLADYFTSGAKR